LFATSIHSKIVCTIFENTSEFPDGNSSYFCSLTSFVRKKRGEGDFQGVNLRWKWFSLRAIWTPEVRRPTDICGKNQP